MNRSIYARNKENNGSGKDGGCAAYLAALAAGASFLFLSAGAAIAAETDAAAVSSAEADTSQTGDLGDIVVTANRREQSLQSIGISVTAVSGDALIRSGLKSTSDLVISVPGLQIAEPGSTFTSLISIRGVSQNDFTGHLESPNSLYVDDAYLPVPSMNAQPLYDVKRVEVLKGPQGTLFGRNSVGGLVNVITNNPTDKAEGYLIGELGRFNAVNLQGALSGPIADGVSARVAFYKSYRDGYLKNDIGPDQNNDNTLALRGKLNVEVNDRLTILLNGDYYQFRSNAAGAAFLQGGSPDANGLGTTTPGQLTAYGQTDADGSPYTVSVDFPGGLHRTSWNAGGKISYEADAATIVAQTNVGYANSRYAEDNDLSPVDYTRFFQNSKARYFTQELRASGKTDRLSWTAGLYYLNIDGGPYSQTFDLRAFGAALATDYSLKTRSWSAFGQGELTLTDTVSVTVGARYTRDRKKFAWTQGCTNGTPTLLPAVPGGYCPLFAPPPGTQGSVSPYADRHSEGGLSGRVELDWKPISNLLLYATYNRGYKAFNYNTGFSGLAPINGIRFKGERMNAFEVGEKATLLGGKARANIAAFYYDYGNYQAFDQRGLNLTLYNTDATIKGLEAEFALRPGAGFDLSVGGTYLDAKVDDVPVGTALVSRKPPQSPKYTLLGSISNTQPVFGGQAVLQFNGNYTAAQYSQLTNAPATRLPGYFVGNTRLSYTPDSGAWEVAVFVRNVFNENSPRYAFDLTGAPIGQVEYDYALPRTWGGSLRVNF